MKFSLIQIMLLALFLKAPGVFAESEMPTADQPVVFYADDIQYDRNNGVWTASGRVEFSQKGCVLEADRVLFHEKSNLVTAVGSVRLRESNGEILHAEYAELSGDLKDGVLFQVRLLMSDDGRLAANKAKRKKHEVIFDEAVYTPCYPCTQDPTFPPTWEIKARKIFYNQLTSTVTTIDPHMTFLGIPFLYTPACRFSTKRSSGFLTPYFIGSTNLGTGFGIPYYMALDPSRDLTLTPFFMTKQGGFLGGVYRQQWNHRNLNVNGSLAGKPSRQTQRGVEKKRIPQVRGHLFASGETDINQKWRLSWDGKFVSDKTYPRFFRDLPPFKAWWSDPFLQSDLLGERFSEKDYLSISALGYQGLRDEDSATRTPLVAPFVTYHQTSNPLLYGSYLTFDSNLISLYRREGNKYQRMIFQGGWTLPHTFSNGQMISVFGNFRSDFYHATVTLPSDPRKQIFKGNLTRFFPQAGIEGRWPLSIQSKAIFEPILQVVAAPHAGSTLKVPDEDSSGFEFTYANLFKRNRFPGYDRLDSGSRAVWGTRFLVPYYQARVFIGQSYALSTPPTDLYNLGIHKKFSDFVGYAQITPHPWFGVDYHFRIERSGLKSRSSDLYATLGPEIFRVGVNYTSFIPKLPTLNTPALQPSIDQIGFNLNSQVTQAWSVQLLQLRNLKAGGILSQGIQVLYQNECLVISAGFGRSYYSDRDIKPATVFSLSISLKNLGSKSFSPSPAGRSSGINPLFSSLAVSGASART